MDGKLIIFSAPSGSGKTTIVREILKKDLNLEFSISACTREPRPGEINGKDYYFLSGDEFRDKIKTNNFIEWEEVYENQYYGTLKSEMERIWNKGKHVIFDIDVMGGINLKRQFGNKALSIFIMAPSLKELESRLRNRGTDDEASLSKRIAKASFELSYKDQFDIKIINDDLKVAIKQTCYEIKKFLNHE